MVVYVDLVFLINFIFDFFLLLTVNITLKRYAKVRYIILASLFGSISLISLFIKINYILFFLFKIFMGIIMCLIAFGYKNIRYTFYNFLYLFMTSMILGGFLYYLKSNLSNISYILLIIISPFILYIFIKSIKALKEIKNYYYKVTICFNNSYSFVGTGFLDTGNKLVDPITNKAVIIINKRVLKGFINIRSPMYIPYNSLNNHGLLECIKPKYIEINGNKLTNYLVGFSDNNFKLNGVDCLLNYKILEDINV